MPGRYTTWLYSYEELSLVTGTDKVGKVDNINTTPQDGSMHNDIHKIL